MDPRTTLPVEDRSEARDPQPPSAAVGLPWGRAPGNPPYNVLRSRAAWRAPVRCGERADRNQPLRRTARSATILSGLSPRKGGGVHVPVVPARSRRRLSHPRRRMRRRATCGVPRRGRCPAVPGSYRLPEPGPGAPSTVDAGMLLSVMTRDEAHELFAPFQHVVVNRSSIESAEGQFVDDDWHIHATR